MHDSFLSRKYTKGIYLEHIAHNRGTGKHSHPNDNTLPPPQPVSLSYVFHDTTNNPPEINHQQNNQNTDIKKYTALSITTSHQNIHSSVISSKKSTTYITNKSDKSTLTIQKQKLPKQTFTPSDDDKIIQIILALFPILCLIAIYLHDGQTITNNFWIDLILHLTFIGAIIFAILVVLDVINLK